MTRSLDIGAQQGSLFLKKNQIIMKKRKRKAITKIWEYPRDLEVVTE